MDIRTILLALMSHTGWSQETLAERLDTTQSTISRWLGGAEPRGDTRDKIRELAIRQGLDPQSPAEHPGRQVIPLMGYVGAGGDIDPDYEQVPDDGLAQIELPYIVGIVGDPIAFEVRGESNLPKYADGDILIVEREQSLAFDSLIGGFAVVLTASRRRYVKKIMPGAKPKTYDLLSVNAPTMESQKLTWASPVQLVIPAFGLKKKPAGKART